MTSVSKARETWHSNDVPKESQIDHALLQLASEAGELAGMWAKHRFKPGHSMTRDMVLDELGDVWYYVRIMCYLYGISIERLTNYNYEKLQGGHGWDGSSEKALKGRAGALW